MTLKMKNSGVEWIGDIPEDWRAMFAFQCFEQVKNKNTDMGNSNLLSLSYGKLKRKNIETVDGLLPESFENYNIIDKDDIVLRLTDLQNDKKSLRVGLAEERGIITSAYTTLRNKSISLPKYLYYYLHAFDISKGFYGMGAGVRQGLNWDELKHLIILSPTISNQTRIVGFLDYHCALIDKIIDSTKLSIDEYKNLKQSIITQAVIKGVRGNRPMKDSVIEWVEEIPENWSIMSAFQCFTPIKNKNHGLTEKNLLSLSYGKIKRKNIDTVEGLLPESFDTYNIIDKDDIVLRLTDLQNDHKSLRVGIATERGIITSAYVTIKNTSDNNSRYLYYYLHSFDIAKGFYGMGSGVRQGLNWDELKHLKICCPPINEQLEIVSYLDKKGKEIDSLITKKEDFLKELENYKRSMIYEYVTGKKEA